MSRFTQQHDDDEDIEVLDHAVLDAMDEEEFSLYMDDPKAFKEKHPDLFETAAATDTAAPATDDAAEPPRQPAAERTPEGDATASATADTATDESTDVVIENPWKDQGIPDIWVIDPETGENYENGLIMGKYTTPDKAFEGAMHAQKLIGKKRLDPDADTRGHVEQAMQPGFLQTVPLDPQTDQSVWDHSYQYAIEQYSQDIQALGLTREDFGENLEGLRAADPQLYRDIRKAAESRYPLAAQFVQNYVATREQRDALEAQSMEAGYNLFVDAFEAATGLESDAEDQANLEGAYNAFLTGVTQMDLKYQQLQADHPTVNIYADPAAAQFYARYYEVVNGVPVLSPDKVANAALIANNHLYQSAIKRSAVETYKAQLAKVSDEAPRFPRTATTAQDDGATGSAMPRPTDEEFYAPDYFDRLTKAFGGDEEKAQQFYDKIVDERDAEWSKSAPRTPQRANY